MNNEIITLINKISNMNGNSLLEKIVDHCETYDVDEKELGDILNESEEFKDILYNNCVKHNIIKDKILKDSFRKSDIEEW
jgi:hypothetical protein